MQPSATLKGTNIKNANMQIYYVNKYFFFYLTYIMYSN